MSTIRVSLATDSVHEVEVGHQILKSLRLGRPGVNIIACPTCGRLAGDLFSVVNEVEAAVKKAKFEKDLNVALMGCAVNGPGEAAGADLGVSLGRGRAHLFKHGEIVRTVPEGEIVKDVALPLREVASIAGRLTNSAGHGRAYHKLGAVPADLEPPFEKMQLAWTNATGDFRFDGTGFEASIISVPLPWPSESSMPPSVACITPLRKVTPSELGPMSR